MTLDYFYVLFMVMTYFMGTIRCRPVESEVESILENIDILYNLLPTSTCDSQTDESTASTSSTTEKPGLNSVIQGLTNGGLADPGGVLTNAGQAMAGAVQTVVGSTANLQGMEALGMTPEDIKTLGTLETIGKLTSGSIIPSSSTSMNPFTAIFSNPLGLLGSLLGSTRLGNNAFTQKYLDIIIALCQFWLKFMYELFSVLFSSQSSDILLSLILPAYSKMLGNS